MHFCMYREICDWAQCVYPSVATSAQASSRRSLGQIPVKNSIIIAKTSKGAQNFYNRLIFCLQIVKSIFTKKKNGKFWKYWGQFLLNKENWGNSWDQFSSNSKIEKIFEINFYQKRKLGNFLSNQSNQFWKILNPGDLAILGVKKSLSGTFLPKITISLCVSTFIDRVSQSLHLHI